jgi:hypothetical protein
MDGQKFEDIETAGWPSFFAAVREDLVTSGTRPAIVPWQASLTGVFFLAPAISIIIPTLSRLTVLFLPFAIAFVATWLWARRQRKQGWGEAQLIYKMNPMLSRTWD